MNTSLIITGIVCYLLGLFIGIFATRTTFRAKLKQSFEDGTAEGKREAEEQTAAATEELGVQLSVMRDNLLHTFEAYQGALQVVDDKLRPGTLEQLSLTFEKSGEPKQIDFQPSHGLSEDESSFEGTEETSQELLPHPSTEDTAYTEEQTGKESDNHQSSVKDPSLNGNHPVHH